MKLLIGVILVVIALIMKKREAKSAGKTPSTPRPAMPADEVLRRHREMVEQQMRQLQEQQPIDSEEYDEDENYDEDEEYEEGTRNTRMRSTRRMIPQYTNLSPLHTTNRCLYSCLSLHSPIISRI